MVHTNVTCVHGHGVHGNNTSLQYVLLSVHVHVAIVIFIVHDAIYVNDTFLDELHESQHDHNCKSQCMLKL